MSIRKKEKRSIYNFNHISDKLPEDEIAALKKLYKTYHRKFFVFKKRYQHIKRMSIVLNILSITLTTTGLVVGSASLNPIIVASVGGPGVILQGYLKIRKYDKSLEGLQNGYRAYKNFLNQIKAGLRGDSIVLSEVVLELRFIDDLVINTCPIIPEKYFKMYDNRFTD